MKKPFFGTAAAVSAAAVIALGASVANAESKVGQSILSADIPVQAMSATEMEAVEGQFWGWWVRINGATDSGNSDDDGPNQTINDEPLGGGTYSVDASETDTTSSVQVSTSCSGSCSSTGIAVAGSWWN